MKSGWTTHRGIAVALPIEGINTDQLMPARFMSTPRDQGYAKYLLHDLRRDSGGELAPDFPLNRPEAGDASILVARRNFGGGSSREAAVYALVDAGIRAVIAPSFGDIFAGNAANNGLLAAQVTEQDAGRLLAALESAPAPADVDLEGGSITIRDLRVAFNVDEVRRLKIINNWDDIDLTRNHSAQIAAYRKRLQITRPWVFPRD
ncbi:MAG: 3-isopropylmalate dehydratase small subunit [Gammaproteobacteria bacterium]|nr:3-isopropylmalate dehydratase small subunit [Gammaproteobacteria bacterium]